MNILIAEDNTTSRCLLRRILEKDPENKITEAEDGLVAWNKLEQAYWQGSRPDLCLSDIVMPKLDGFELVRRIRCDSRFRDLPVVFCSALKDRVSIAQAAELSVQYFITKPYAVQTVLAQIQKAKETYGQHRVLNDPTITCERLGIDMPTFQNLVTSLLADVDRTVEVLCSALVPGKLSQAEMKIDSLRGASSDLGAEGLRQAAESLQRVLKIEGSPWEVRFAEGGVDPKASFEEWLRNHRPFIMEGYGRLKQEGARLQDALARLHNNTPLAELAVKKLAVSAAAVG